MAAITSPIPCTLYNVPLTHGMVGSTHMFPSLESWLTCEYGRNDGRTSETKKVIELMPGSFGTLAHGTLSPCLKGSQAAHGKELRTSPSTPAEHPDDRQHQCASHLRKQS